MSSFFTASAMKMLKHSILLEWEQITAGIFFSLWMELKKRDGVQYFLFRLCCPPCFGNPNPVSQGCLVSRGLMEKWDRVSQDSLVSRGQWRSGTGSNLVSCRSLAVKLDSIFAAARPLPPQRLVVRMFTETSRTTSQENYC